MNDLKSLLERVEKAEGPDREIDKLIAVQVAGLCLHERTTRNGPEGDIGYDCDDCGGDSWGNKGRTGQALYDKLPSYTASIDAAVGLVEKMLPVCGYGCSLRWTEISRSPDEAAHGWIHHGDDTHEGDAYTPALALISALLKALIAQQEIPTPPQQEGGE